MKKLLALALVCLACLLVFEIALRLTGQRYMGSFFIFDRERGWAHRPGASGWQTAEGEAWVQINADGMRDVDHPLQKPANTVRIAVLGDSFTEALQVEASQSFTSLLPQQLAGCPALGGRTIETMNFGTGGYGTGMELLTYRAQVRKYKPDIVVLAFFTQNDPFDNHEWLSPNRSGAGPYFRLVNGQITKVNPIDNYSTWQLRKAEIVETLRGLVNYSRLLQLFLHVQNMRRVRAGFQDNSGKAAALLGAGFADRIVYQPKLTPEIEDAWQITEALLKKLRDETAADNARFRLVTLTNPIQVHPDEAAREAFRQQIGGASLAYPEQRLRGFAALEKISLTTLAETMAMRAAETKVFYHGFANTKMGTGHWNQQGHRAAAEIMAPDICSDLAR